MKVKKSFEAAMFDFDGTVTERGIYTPPKELAEALVKLTEKMPIAFCTGRQFESFERRGLINLLGEVAPEKMQAFLENLFLIAENGSVGYFFDTDLDEFQEFYRAAWPEEFIKRETLIQILQKEIGDHGEMLDTGHRVIVVMRTNLYDSDHSRIEEVYALSDKIYEVCCRVLKEIDPDYEKYLHVGNSGIGVLVCPADSDKDEGVRRFGAYLREKRQIKFDEKFSEIMVVGDSPQEGGNDRYFLSGRFGTPFTVGDLNPKIEALNVAMDNNGNRLMNAKGTLHLVNTLLLKD